MIPILKEGDAFIFENCQGKVVLRDVVTQTETVYANPEACWRALQEMKRGRLS